MTYSTKNRSRKRPSNLLTSFLALAVIIAVIVSLELTNTTHIFHKAPPRANFPITHTQGGASATSQKGQPKASTPSSSENTSPGPASIDTSKSTGGTTTATLITPTGDFVSNHTPGQHNSPQAEASVCNTTAGATCQIVFTNGDTTKSLPTQTTDINGSTYWNNWTPASIGLTSGSWQIKALATLNGQTRTATDPMELTVQ